MLLLALTKGKYTEELGGARSGHGGLEDAGHGGGCGVQVERVVGGRCGGNEMEAGLSLVSAREDPGCGF